MTFSACLDGTPKTILCACNVSLTAVPCDKNSGLDTISILTSCFKFFLIKCSIFLLVPIGTVDFTTTTQSFSIELAISSATV